MSMQEEVSLASTVPDGDTDDLSEIMALAVQEVEHCSRVTDDSLPKICSEMEGATSELMIRPVFRRFNSVTQIFLRLVPAAKASALISKALNQLGASLLLLTFFGQPTLYRGGYLELQVIYFGRASSFFLGLLASCAE